MTRPLLHQPRYCPICQSFRRAVLAGEATCIHAYEVRGSDGWRCELCWNYRSVIEKRP